MVVDSTISLFDRGRESELVDMLRIEYEINVYEKLPFEFMSNSVKWYHYNKDHDCNCDKKHPINFALEVLEGE